MTTTTTEISETVTILKVQTLANGGIRWTFDAPETAVLSIGAPEGGIVEKEP